MFLIPEKGKRNLKRKKKSQRAGIRGNRWQKRTEAKEFGTSSLAVEASARFANGTWLKFCMNRMPEKKKLRYVKYARPPLRTARRA
jgi:hypothetical protein